MPDERHGDRHAIAPGVVSVHEAEVRAAVRIADARTAALLDVECATHVMPMVEDIRAAPVTSAAATRELDRDLPSTRQVLDAVDEVRASLATFARTAETVGNRDRA